VPNSLRGEDTAGEEREQVGSRRKDWGKKEQLGTEGIPGEEREQLRGKM
jgi:hypothetical protein